MDVLQIKIASPVTAGSGPRHLNFSKTRQINLRLARLSEIITVYGYKEGKLVKKMKRLLAVRF
jgi:6-phosphogluconolactonase (cycloisomerase 2 family)